MARPPIRPRWLAALVLGLPACDSGSASGAGSEIAAEPVAASPAELSVAAPEPAPVVGADPTPSSPTQAQHEPPPAGATTATREAEVPIGRRRARRPLMVYFEPRLETEFRGKIQLGEVFELLERVPGEGCGGEGWGRVGEAAFVCLRHAEPTEDRGTALPSTLPDGLAPFLYARRRPNDEENPTAAPLWRSRPAMKRGDPPEGHLELEHDYAFVRRRRFRDDAVLYTHDGRVVRERDVKRLAPSEFAGRDLRARPIPAGTVMAWSITWPAAVVRAEPGLEAEQQGALPLHQELLVHDEPREHGGETWYPASEGGWVAASEIRRFVPMAIPEGIGPDEVWLDVDLQQQVLALHRGSTPEMVTLVSTGNHKHGTPVGLFRIESKWAWADMRSRAGDDETYFVEGVPWVLYFKGRYALHGTFWHNRFGRRTSHGCVNLSAHDARWVYERTSPEPKPGWIVINEHAREPGTLVRIRNGTQVPPDRRRPLPA